MRPILLALFFLLSAAASAAPLTWTLNGVAFHDGATAIGSFDYDSNTGIYSAINVVTTSGSVLSGDTYARLGGPASSAERLGLGGSSVWDILVLDFVAPLTDSGGAVTLTQGAPQFGSLESDSFDFRYITAGTVSAVPVPAAFWLFGSGLGLLGWMRRKPTV